jgi:preprotein translocase subunit SecY
MSAYKNFLQLIPEVADPTKKQTLKKRLLWTFGILMLFLFLSAIPLFGVTAEQALYFKNLELIFGAKIGKLLTLGIGPIVTSSIVLQLLRGAGILKFDFSTEEGKFVYSGTHKIVTFLFIILESIVYVAFGAVEAQPGMFALVSLQLALGAFLVFYMDEVVKKWGIGSGVSLFIAAGIAQTLFVQAFSPFFIDPTTGASVMGWPFGGSEAATGKLWAGIYFLANAMPMEFLTSVLGPILITVGLFFLITFFQSVNVEIPLSMGRIRGQSIRWPLNFFYAGVIPIILISALSANFVLWASLWEGFRGLDPGSSFLSTIVSYLQPISIWQNWGNLASIDLWLHMIIYIIFLVLGATLFSWFWVQSSGQDSRSQAKQILNSGLQIPGFRKDGKIIERILDRYIGPLTVMGGIAIGLLAATADVLSALIGGTSILLLTMIIYQFYQQLARESMEDFSLLKKFMRK